MKKKILGILCVYIYYYLLNNSIAFSNYLLYIFLILENAVHHVFIRATLGSRIFITHKLVYQIKIYYSSRMQNITLLVIYCAQITLLNLSTNIINLICIAYSIKYNVRHSFNLSN